MRELKVLKMMITETLTRIIILLPQANLDNDTNDFKVLFLLSLREIKIYYRQ